MVSWDVERVGMLAYHFGPTWAATVYKRGRRVFGPEPVHADGGMWGGQT